MRTVDAIKPAKRGGMLVVHLSDGSLVRLSPDAVVAHRLAPGCELSDEALADLEATRLSEAARKCAANIVSAVPVSTAELRRRLVRKGYPEEEAAAATEWLCDLGVLDDAAYAAALVEKCGHAGLSRRATEEKLREKGVPRDLAEDAMCAFTDPTDALDRLVRQKRGDAPLTPEARRKLIASLARKGFGFEEIRASLRRLGEDAEE